ncbi:hypothetical protein EXN66_Car006516 [Channa argus]|uniref:Uncharacterized protein n=1 Tax=Channa argus TaxID=215402 RepID=A0A6G1PKR5_CHAAH|nr:hypothetical protein EXN66_Car006516 [Channa argus]
METINTVSKCSALHKGVCGQHEQRRGRRSCWRGNPSDPVDNETLPVPLSVLTGRLCHTTHQSSCSRHPTSLRIILSCQYQTNSVS